MLEIKNLKKSFVSPDGERMMILDIPQFAMASGEQLALEGGSGTGKTTFLHVIAGILQADSGSIHVAGREISTLSESERDGFRSQTIGYVFQTFNLLQGYTALENVALGMAFGRGIDIEYAKSLLARVGMQDRMNYRPRQLSVGQQQRVAVARALANHPQLVLADEPTGNLDHKHAKDSLHLIREVCREKSAGLLLVSHDRDVLSDFKDVKRLADLNGAIS
ncbi:MAG TPA: ABC transporter ATP-binding protein [Elusimicrobiota bacterium]|nr:ABC transporter ATP-binding protein [Elusimicrobiota bacterium]